MDVDSEYLATPTAPGQLNLGLVYKQNAQSEQNGGPSPSEIMLSYEWGKFPGAFAMYLSEDETRALGELLRNKSSGRIGGLEISSRAVTSNVPPGQLTLIFDTGFRGILFVNLSDAVVTQLAAQCDIMLNELQQIRAQP